MLKPLSKTRSRIMTGNTVKAFPVEIKGCSTMNTNATCAALYHEYHDSHGCIIFDYSKAATSIMTFFYSLFPHAKRLNLVT